MDKCEIEWANHITSKEDWFNKNQRLLAKLKNKKREEHINIARSSQSRIYKDLDFSKGITYCNDSYSQSNITWIIKARGDMLWLNGNRFNNTGLRICSLCNLCEEEGIAHFLGRCPVLKEIRLACFNQICLNEDEILNILNGYRGWGNLATYVEKAILYRKYLVDEFNF